MPSVFYEKVNFAPKSVSLEFMVQELTTLS